MNGRRESGAERDGQKSAGENQKTGRVVRHQYTPEEKAFFAEYTPGHSHKEIQEEFTKRFGWNIGMTQVQTYIHNHRLQTGRDGRFQKGMQPHNKGKKVSSETYEKIKGTMFQKGHMPKNICEVGSTRMRKDGYIEIKVEEPNKWRGLHRHKWQQAYGPIPRGHCLIFKDNDRTNCELENLMLITRNELRIMNQNNLNEATGDLKEVAANLAKVIETSQNKRKNMG